MHTLFALSALIATSTALPPFLRQIFPADRLLTWPYSNDIDDDDLLIDHTTVTVTLHPTTTSAISLLLATSISISTSSTTTTTTPISASTPRVSCIPYSGSSSPPSLLSDSPFQQNPSLLSSYALQLADSFCSSVPPDTDFHHRTLPLRIPVSLPLSSSSFSSSACHPSSSSATPDSDDSRAAKYLTPLSSHTTPALLTFTFDGATTTSVRRHRFETQSHTPAECRVGCLDAMQTLIQECGFGGKSESEAGAIEAAAFEEGEGDGQGGGVGVSGCGRWGVWVKWLSEEEMRAEREGEGNWSNRMKEVGSGGDKGEEEGDKEAWRLELR